MRILVCLSLGLLVGLFVLPSHGQSNGVGAVQETYAAFATTETDQTRQALLEALNGYDGKPTVDTVQAHLALVLSDTRGEIHANMRASALAAIAHLEPVSDLLPRQYVEAKYIAATAYFNHEQHPNAMLEMAQVEGYARQFYDSTGDKPAWADTLKWQAEAWGMAMRAHFESKRIRHPSEQDIDAILASYRNNQRLLDQSILSDRTGLPRCAGRLIQRPRMRYPSRSARNGTVGAVILRLALDSEGQVINPEILASVPLGAFDEQTLTTVEKWQYRADKPREVGHTCTLEQTNIVMPFAFSLD